MKKVLKFFGILILVLVVAFLATGAFVEGHVHIEKTVTINKDKATVFNYVKHLNNHPNFTKWQEMDPNQTHTLDGTDGTPGAVFGWSSQVEDVGEGEQEIVSIKDGERIDFALRFKKPMETESTAYITTSDADGATTVAWGLDFDVPYPWNTFNLFTDMDEMVGKDFQYGLDKLKGIMEEG